MVEVNKVAKAPSNTRYNHGHYPWDDYQDELVVNSVEHAHPRGQKVLVGVEHYNELLSKAGPYKHITCNFDHYKTNGRRLENVPEPEEEVELGLGFERHPQVHYGVPPKPPKDFDDYDDWIYHAKTRSPAVCLAVVRIARHNLPFVDFTSSLNHLPNQPPDAPLPKLPLDGFIADIPHEGRATDLDASIAFLPCFYHDGRHALGFFVLSPDPRPDQPTRKWTRTCLFTPCTFSDLVRTNMVEWLPDSIRRDDVENILAVGSRDGKWLDPDLEEHKMNWMMCWRVASNIWEKRMKLCRGAQEVSG
ncbi:hypothetical protein BKA63DRAFT_470740 [Paraphoma chrysanthemicola]|nr:hypothetical protein BKA63DRAFT_470740 [Paraphoma chrysanthemicola]